MPDDSLESGLRARGHRWIAGIDVAGRGPLAGPVAAAAVILPADFAWTELNDSKKLTKIRREKLYRQLTDHADVIWHVAFVPPAEVDRLNILRATHLAMKLAAEGLRLRPCHCLIDGLPVRDFPFSHTAVVKGDALAVSISAASIVAKVARDRWMAQLDLDFPQYGFARHQGYATKEHLEALRHHGPCRHHRQSFQPVAQLALPLGEI